MTMQSVQQLDIFADSHDGMLRNDVLEQLQRRNAVSARTARELLANEYPDDDTLRAMSVLVDELERASTAPFGDHAALATTRSHLEDEVVSAARRVLPAQIVTHGWHQAGKPSPIGPRPWPFAAPRPIDAAPLWLRAGEWATASEAVDGIESWWPIPAPAAWMTEARYRAGDWMPRGRCSLSWRGWPGARRSAA